MREKELQEGNLLKVLIRLIIPSFITVVVSSSYSVVDGIFIGRKYGIVGNSTLSYTFILYSLVFSVACLICQGAPSLVAIKMGEKNVEEAEKMLGASVWSSIFIAIVQAIIVYVSLKPIIRVLGCEKTFDTFIIQYFQVFLFFSPIYFVNHTLLYCLRSQGALKLIVVCNLLSCLTNIKLDQVFIMKLDWGFRGAAFATIIANFVSMLFCIWCYRTGKAGLRLRFSKIKPDFKATKEMIEVGSASFLMNVLYTMILVYYNKVAKSYGSTYGLAALSIDSTIYKYLTVVMNAITVGMQPVICYSYGGKNYKRVMQGLKDSLFIGAVISCVSYIFLICCSGQIIRMFNPEKKFVVFAARSLRLVILCLPLQVAYTIGTAFFQFVEKGKLATGFVALRQVIVQIPACILLTGKLGLDGLWHSFWIADLFSFMVLAVFFIYQFIQYNKGLAKNVS